LRTRNRNYTQLSTWSHAEHVGDLEWRYNTVHTILVRKLLVKRSVEVKVTQGRNGSCPKLGGVDINGVNLPVTLLRVQSDSESSQSLE
jgi:hypothetical protein